MCVKILEETKQLIGFVFCRGREKSPGGQSGQFEDKSALLTEIDELGSLPPGQWLSMGGFLYLIHQSSPVQPQCGISGPLQEDARALCQASTYKRDSDFLIEWKLPSEKSAVSNLLDE